MDVRTQKLHDIMNKHGLTAVDVASILGREVITVRIWRTKTDTRIIPADALELLALKAPSFAKGRK